MKKGFQSILIMKICFIAIAGPMPTKTRGPSDPFTTPAHENKGAVTRRPPAREDKGGQRYHLGD